MEDKCCRAERQRKDVCHVTMRLTHVHVKSVWLKLSEPTRLFDVLMEQPKLNRSHVLYHLLLLSQLTTKTLPDSSDSAAD